MRWDYPSRQGWALERVRTKVKMKARPQDNNRRTRPAYSPRDESSEDT